MKEATGEANMTVVTIILIAAIVAIATPLITNMMNSTKQKAENIKCPLIAESPISIECKVKDIKELGSHHMFIADVLSIDVAEKYIDSAGAFDISKCGLIAYANGGYYNLDKKIGKFGYSVQKNLKK